MCNTAHDDGKNPGGSASLISFFFSITIILIVCSFHLGNSRTHKYDYDTTG